MRTLRLYARDLRVGLPSVRPYLVAALVLGVVHGIAAAGNCAYSGNDLSSFTFSDYVALTFQFANPVDLWLLIQGRPLTITFPWFFSFAVLFAATLEYPRADLLGAGYRGVVASGSRWAWWIAKCAWVCTVAAAFWVLLFAGLILTAWAFGAQASEFMSEFAMIMVPASSSTRYPGMSMVPLMLLTVPICASMMLVQLAVSVRVERMPGYLLCMGVFFASGMVEHPLLLGNYLISGRSAGAYVEGLPMNDGLALSLAVAWIAVAVGGLLVSRMTIYGGSRDE